MWSLTILTLALSAPPQEGPTFLAVSAGPSADPVRGLLVRLTDATATLRSAAGNVQISNLVSLSQVGKRVPPPPSGPVLITVAGDRVPGHITGGDDRGIIFQADLGEPDPSNWKVPYSAISALWQTTPPADTPSDPARYPWVGDDRRDVIQLRNGDVLRGTLESVGLEIRIKVADSPVVRSLPLSSLSAIAFNPALTRVRKPKEPYAQAILANGTRLSLTGVTLQNGHLEARTFFGVPIRVRLDEIVTLEVLQGKALYLSDLKPTRIDRQDYLGVPRVIGSTTSSFTGEPLVLPGMSGDRVFDRGLRTMAQSTIVYDLSPRFKRFDTIIGLPAKVTKGSAFVRILLDGKDILDPQSRRLTPGVAHELSLPIHGGKELTLMIDFGPSGGVQSEVLWGNARFVE